MTLLLGTDLDRTLLPNGPQPESPGARAAFHRLVDHADVTLVYVTGRDRRLVEQAIEEYGLPVPDFVIGDVGSSIHQAGHQAGHRSEYRAGHRSAATWQTVAEWDEHIGKNWAGRDWHDLAKLLAPVLDAADGPRLQEPEKQNRFKLSYYLPLQADQTRIANLIQEKLDAAGIAASLTWSVDEAAGVGLLDVLPTRASKLHALEYLQGMLGIGNGNTVFAGDSGNDLPVLTSPVPSVLVANASPEIAGLAVAQASKSGTREQLYLAKGGFLEMNGNYAAGILEGVAHYHPDLAERMRPDGQAKRSDDS